MDAPLDTGTLQALRLVPGPDGRPLVDHVIRLAMEALPTHAQKLHECAAQADWEALRRTAHTLKGTSGSFGAKVLSEQAKTLESAALVADGPWVASCLDDVTREIGRVMEALRELQSS
ncbi:MAG: Hpt domain-containing protein [Acidobacteria bacterium]|nr:Hpt domain-containing protein [Acidobacteriota bacterium]